MMILSMHMGALTNPLASHTFAVLHSSQKAVVSALLSMLRDSRHGYIVVRVGRGLLWLQVCPAAKAYWASFWQGFLRQMDAITTAHFFKLSGPPAVLGEQLVR